MIEDESLRQILKNAKTIAVVGLSDKPDRPSYHVASYLKDHGYKIIPVHPRAAEVLGEKVYPSLSAVPKEIAGRIDIVDIFLRAESIPPVVEEALQTGAGLIWMQEGISNPQAAERARTAGLEVVMDRCILKEHMRLCR